MQEQGGRAAMNDDVIERYLVQVDDRHRLTIPRSLRKRLGKQRAMFITIHDDGVVTMEGGNQ